MPGPGPHMMYALGAGTALMRLSCGRFGPHHVLFYAINAFLGPDLGSFAGWLFSGTGGIGRSIGSLAMKLVHDPFLYPLLLGVPLCFLYSSISSFLFRSGVLDASPGRENGHSAVYTWILSTGWWKGEAPINPDAVFVVGFLCTCLIAGFISAVSKSSSSSLKLILLVGSMYCMWCASQIYWRDPPAPPVGEEADLGVLLFLAAYFFLPHSLCFLSMDDERGHSGEQQESDILNVL